MSGPEMLLLWFLYASFPTAGLCLRRVTSIKPVTKRWLVKRGLMLSVAMLIIAATGFVPIGNPTWQEGVFFTILLPVVVLGEVELFAMWFPKSIVEG